MFDEAKFQAALKRSRLRDPVPEWLENRGERVRVMTEGELQAMTARWFVDFQDKIDHHRKLGFELGWLMEWAKKYWWSWLARDMDLNHELYTADLRYKDPTTFGRTLVGLDEFVTYNFAFFDAIPDWRYDPLPDQVYIDVTADGRVRTLIRYIGTGHIDGALKLYPYDDSAPSIPGTGAFVQCAALDRYHFNADGLMEEGETLFDFLDATQSAGLLPRDDSWQFKLLTTASRVPATLQRLRR